MQPRLGYSLLELLAALALIALLVSLAAPRFTRTIARVRARSALDRIAAEIYRARMIAVQEGATVRLILHTDSRGCIRQLRIVPLAADPATFPPSATLDAAAPLPEAFRRPGTRLQQPGHAEATHSLDLRRLPAGRRQCAHLDRRTGATQLSARAPEAPLRMLPAPPQAKSFPKRKSFPARRRGGSG